MAASGGNMPMPGGWTMSMAWMRMAGQSWPGAAAAFLGMWILMMVPMMMPSLMSMLWRYRAAARAAGAAGGLGRPTAAAGAAYFVVWAAAGAVLYPLGVAVAAAEMRWPALARRVPLAVAAAALLAGVVQLSPWKRRHLACCRDMPARAASAAPGERAAFRHGLRLGQHCVSCCASFIIILLAAGVMDLAVMAAVTAGITTERLTPRSVRAATVVGVLILAAGAAAGARALGAHPK
jgi:predicted metal-binding membrane protein